MGPQDALGLRGVGFRPGGGEGYGVGFVSQASPDHLGPVRRLGQVGEIDHQAEAVEQLRPQFPLFRVHRADQHESGRMTQGKPFALHAMYATGRGIEQDIYQVVGEQIDLIDVEDAAIGSSEQAGLEGTLAT